MKSSCPLEEKIADYHLGFLPPNQIADIEAHFAGCEKCIDELITIENIGLRYVADEYNAVTENNIQKVLGLIQNRAFSRIEIAMRKFKKSIYNQFLKTYDCLNTLLGTPLRLATIRGSKKIITKDMIKLNLKFKEINAIVNIEKAREKLVNIRVNIVKEIEQNGKIRVSLQKDERDLFSYIPDIQGQVFFENIMHGRYVLTFSRNGKIVSFYPFEIKEASNDKRKKNGK